MKATREVLEAIDRLAREGRVTVGGVNPAALEQSAAGVSLPGGPPANFLVVPGWTEEEFSRELITFARGLGWAVAHFRPAKTKDGWRTAVQGDGAGWPDLFLVRRDRAVAAELKVGGNKPTQAQRKWLRLLGEAGVRCFTWRPADHKLITEVLR